jgi:hypothetical protein
VETREAQSEYKKKSENTIEMVKTKETQSTNGEKQRKTI